MAPKRPGPSSAYLGAHKDKAGEWLDGGNSYRLRVPANPPITLLVRHALRHRHARADRQ